MDLSKLDPALLGLLGVMVGSILSLIGNFLGQWFTLRRDERNWERQRRTEKEDAEAQERKNEIDRVQNIYTNCISRLSLLASSSSNKRELTEEELGKLQSESVEWVTRLKLHRKDLYSDTSSKFHEEVENFIRRPDFLAGSLLSEINDMFVTDMLLFPNAKPVSEQPSSRTVHITISDTYRRQQIIDGKEIPRNHIVRCNISELSEKQREFLWDIYYETNSAIPSSFVLTLPHFNEAQKKIDFRGKSWEGKINPLTSSPRQIFDSWEKDYSEGLGTAEKLLKLAQNSEIEKQ